MPIWRDPNVVVTVRSNRTGFHHEAKVGRSFLYVRHRSPKCTVACAESSPPSLIPQRHGRCLFRRQLQMPWNSICFVASQPNYTLFFKTREASSESLKGNQDQRCDTIVYRSDKEVLRKLDVSWFSRSTEESHEGCGAMGKRISSYVQRKHLNGHLY